MSRFDVERFEVPPDEEFLCNICQGVLDKPMETPCRHVFCKVCIEKWLQIAETKSCPTCRSAVTHGQLCTALPLLSNLINKLKVHCLNRCNGCQSMWTIETFDNAHENSCEHRNVKCRYEKCKTQVIAKNMSKHEEKCGYRPYTCKKLCGLTILHKEKGTHVCVQLLKDTVEELRKNLVAAQEEVERLKESLTSFRECREQYNNLLNYAPSLHGSDHSGSNRDDEDDLDRLATSDDEHRSNSIDDFLMSSASERTALRSNSGSSVSDSMVGFSESSDNDDNTEVRRRNGAIVISSDSSVGRVRLQLRRSVSPPWYSPQRSPRFDSPSLRDSWSSRSPTPRPDMTPPGYSPAASVHSPTSPDTTRERTLSPPSRRRRRRYSPSPDGSERRRKRRHSSTSSSSSTSSCSSSNASYRRSRKRSRRDSRSRADYSDDSADSTSESQF